jgi:hypothetical protein
MLKEPLRHKSVRGKPISKPSDAIHKEQGVRDDDGFFFTELIEGPINTQGAEDCQPPPSTANHEIITNNREPENSEAILTQAIEENVKQGKEIQELESELIEMRAKVN